jgi:hypothetical protein
MLLWREPLSTFFDLYSRFLDGCRRQKARYSLVQLKQEGHAFGVAVVDIAKKQYPRFNLVTIKNHLVLIK